MRTRLRTIVGMLAVVVLGACANPAASADLAQQLQEMGDVISETRGEASMLRTELDSLRGVVARQDTVLRQLAGMAGVPMR